MSEIGSATTVVLRGVTKSFDGHVANDQINLEFRAGQVHALLGENGAGKSTLMNILSGILAPDTGEIEIEGRPVQIGSPRDAQRLGIGMVHQHFSLIPSLTVAENIHMGWSETPRTYWRPDALERLTRDLAARYAVDIDPAQYVWQLPVGKQQQVEILRTLSRGARILILDEPTAVLTPKECDGLFAMMRTMREDGAVVVFISHKLPEVTRIADWVTVLRLGKVIASLERGSVDARSLATMMVGHQAEASVRAERSAPGAVVLRAQGVCAVDDRRHPAVRDVSLEIRSGEIVGVAGVAGNGQKELAEALTGMRPTTAGTISVSGTDLTGRGTSSFIEAGVGHVPEDRRHTGLAGGLTIWRNAIMKRHRSSRFSTRGVLLERRARSFAGELVESVNLPRSIDTRARHLSGGQAQRLLTAREMDAAGTCLVLAYPTRGLDVGAVAQLHGAIRDARDRGIGMLLISEELDELEALADRIIVVYQGRVAASVDGGSFDRGRIGEVMAGISQELVPDAA